MLRHTHIHYCVHNLWWNNWLMRLPDTGKHYCWIFILYAELQSLALLNDINFFGYEWIFCDWIIGISLMLYDKNSWRFCWQSVKGCDNVRNPTEYRKYFLCTIMAIPRYCSHRLLLKVIGWFWDTLQWPNMWHVVHPAKP